MTAPVLTRGSCNLDPAFRRDDRAGADARRGHLASPRKVITLFSSAYCASMNLILSQRFDHVLAGLDQQIGAHHAPI